MSKISKEAQRHDELPVQHAERRRKRATSRGRKIITSTFKKRSHPCCLFFCAFQGGFDYKRAIVDCIISIIEENPESKETGLAHLCEFIEDCEHTVLATKILHLLGKEGPRTPQPSKYIRFIFNRVVLESEAVRAGQSRFLSVCV